MKKLFLLCFFFLLSCVSTAPIKAPARASKPYQVIWSKDLSPYYRTGNSPYNKRSALIGKNALYVASDLKTLSSYELQTGKKNWSLENEGELVSAPVFIGDHILYGLSSGEIISVDKDGRKIYQKKLEASINAPPVVSGEKVFLSLENHSVLALRYKDGALLWAYQRPLAQEIRLVGGTHLLVDGDYLIGGFHDGYYVSLRAKDGLIRWERRLERSGKFLYMGLRPLKAYGNLYASGEASGLSILDPITGKLKGQVKVKGSSATVKGVEGVLLGTRTGHVSLFSPSGKLLKRVKLSNSPIETLDSWGDYVFASTGSGGLYLLHKESLKPISLFSPGQGRGLLVDGPAFSPDAQIAAAFTTRYRLYVFKK